MPVPSEKNVERLSLYRRLLQGLQTEGRTNIFSHELAQLAAGTAAQVRRDIMAIGYSGHPIQGYDIAGLIESIGKFLDSPAVQDIALVGIGNLGRAIMSHFSVRKPKLRIAAAFDVDPQRTDRVLYGCHCYPTSRLVEIVRDYAIPIGIITVPEDAAQTTADQLCEGGVRGILNSAPVRLHVPEDVYVENLDVSTALEKVAYYARLGRAGSGKGQADKP